MTASDTSTSPQGSSVLTGSRAVQRDDRWTSRWAERGVRWFVIATALAGLCCYVAIYQRAYAEQPIHSDGFSYYVYVPSWFLYHDTTLERLARDWFGGVYPDFTGILRVPATGRFIDPHPIGTAVLMTPFAIAAHALTRWSNLPPDGFSFYYQHAAALAGLAYMLAGLAVLRRTLSRYVTPPIVLATLVTITFGTNLFHYGVFDGTFSHAFAFCLVAVLLELTDTWWSNPTTGRALALGAVSALIVLVRHTNAIFLIAIPAYGLTRPSAIGARLSDLWRRRVQVALMSVVFLLGVFPQLAMYRAATGVWLSSPYATLGAGFDFSAPHALQVLVSPQKGLFFWSPALLLAMLGLLVARGAMSAFTLTAAFVFVVDTWLVGSWFDWQFGGSFGHRAYTDMLALLAFPLAGCFTWAANRRRAAWPICAFAVAAVALSAFKMLQYWLRVLPMMDISWEQYRALFFKLS